MGRLYIYGGDESMIVGKTVDYTGQIINVTECDDCGERTTFTGQCRNCIEKYHMEEAAAGIL